MPWIRIARTWLGVKLGAPADHPRLGTLDIAAPGWKLLGGVAGAATPVPRAWGPKAQPRRSAINFPPIVILLHFALVYLTGSAYSRTSSCSDPSGQFAWRTIERVLFPFTECLLRVVGHSSNLCGLASFSIVRINGL
jgi:hypothetical protein